MTWIKNRNGNEDNILVDSARGATKRLVSNGTGQESTDSSVVHSFKSTGFRIGNSDKVNNSSYTYSSWSFRKQAGFFDVVTYSGTGSTQSVAHSLGTTPGFIMVKALDDRFIGMSLMKKEDIDVRKAIKSIPPLIRAYLRLGGVCGDGAVIDYQFQTTDVFMILAMEDVPEKYREFFVR